LISAVERMIAELTRPMPIEAFAFSASNRNVFGRCPHCTSAAQYFPGGRLCGKCGDGLLDWTHNCSATS
jgi:hypothetical protein